MKFLQGLIASLLITLVFGAVVSFTLNRTLLNPDYLKNQVKKNNLTTGLSEQLPDLLASTMGEKAANSPVTKEAIKSILSPEAMQAKVNDFLGQLKTHLNQNGPLPELDLKDLASQARSKGITIPADAVSKPITIPTDFDKQIKTAFQASQKTQMYSLLAAGVLLLILIALSVTTHSYGSLIYFLVMSAVFQAALWLVLLKGPGLVIVKLQSKIDQAPNQKLVDLAETFIKSVTADISHWFLIWAIIFLGLSIATFALAMVSKAHHIQPVKKPS